MTDVLHFLDQRIAEFTQSCPEQEIHDLRESALTGFLAALKPLGDRGFLVTLRRKQGRPADVIVHETPEGLNYTPDKRVFKVRIRWCINDTFCRHAAYEVDEVNAYSGSVHSYFTEDDAVKAVCRLVARRVHTNYLANMAGVG